MTQRNRKSKSNNQQPQYAGDFRLCGVEPLNHKQRYVLNSKKSLVLSGLAGTGKTYLASYLGYRSIFNTREFNKLVYIRSAVPTRNIGFLPGSDKEKVEVYEAPYIDIATELFNRGDSYEILKKRSIVHFMSTSFIRGTTLKDAFIIVDECQNMTYHELDSIITRIGDNCKIVFCGDIKQADLYGNGFQDFYTVLKNMEEFDFVDFSKEEIVRSEFVKSYIITKDEIFSNKK